MTAEIRSKKPPTIHDLALAVGVHKSTVSLALSGKGAISDTTVQKVLTTARALGYEPNVLAQRLANSARRTSSASNKLICILSSSLNVGPDTEKGLLLRIRL